MKKVFKLLGIIVFLFLLVIGGTLLYFSQKGVPYYEVERPNYHIDIDSTKLERGEKLVMTLCSGCHRNPEKGNLTGKRMYDAPEEFGVIYAPNITQDKEYGIGNWSDADLLVLLRTGIKKDGQYAPPWMAKLPNMADEDIASVIAFLKSDHPAVRADATKDKVCEPSFLSVMLCNTAFKPFPMPDKAINLPNPQDKIQWGKYLSDNFECFSCHSADFKTNNFFEPEKSEGYMAGGNKPLNTEGKIMLTSNLTPDKESGIGTWTLEQFSKAIREGKMDDGKALRYPMQPYNRLSDDEVEALYSYFMSLEPVYNPVERSPFD